MSLYRKATPAELTPAVVLTTTAEVLTVPPDRIAKDIVRKDRHKPGYMAEYMRKRRQGNKR